MNQDIEGRIGRQPQNETETLFRMLVEEKKNKDTPVNEILPTGNLSNEEINFIRRLQNMYEQLVQIKKWLGLKKLPYMEELVEEINFFVESSKSLNGFAATLMITQKSQMFQDLSQTLKDEEEGNGGIGIMDKLSELSENADDDLGIRAPDTSSW